MKKLLVTIMHVAEIEVDDRVSAEDLAWATCKWDEREDGRQPFFTELASHASSEIARSFAECLRGALAGRICDKYPGASQLWYRIVQLLPEFKVGYRIEESLMHCEVDEEVEEEAGEGTEARES